MFRNISSYESHISSRPSRNALSRGSGQFISIKTRSWVLRYLLMYGRCLRSTYKRPRCPWPCKSRNTSAHGPNLSGNLSIKRSKCLGTIKKGLETSGRLRLPLRGRRLRRESRLRHGGPLPLRSNGWPTWKPHVRHWQRRHSGHGQFMCRTAAL